MKERYHLLDALRGFAIYHVIIFHFLYDVYVVYGLNPDWPYQTWVQLWQVIYMVDFLFQVVLVIYMSEFMIIQKHLAVHSHTQ